MAIPAPAQGKSWTYGQVSLTTRSTQSSVYLTTEQEGKEPRCARTHTRESRVLKDREARIGTGWPTQLTSPSGPGTQS